MMFKSMWIKHGRWCSWISWVKIIWRGNGLTAILLRQSSINFVGKKYVNLLVTIHTIQNQESPTKLIITSKDYILFFTHKSVNFFHLTECRHNSEKKTPIKNVIWNIFYISLNSRKDCFSLIFRCLLINRTTTSSVAIHNCEAPTRRPQ